MTVEVKSKPDLVVTDGAIAVVSSSVRPGQSVPVDVLVVNAGGQDSLATTLELSAFTPDGMTTLIESRSVTAIPAG